MLEVCADVVSDRECSSRVVITAQDMLKNVNESFAQLDSNIELLHESMHSDFNVRYSRLETKLNSIWKKFK